MKRRWIEYQLHAGNIPYFVEDGGYFTIQKEDSEDAEIKYNLLLGVSKPVQDCYLPDTVSVMTEAEVVARIVAMPLMKGVEDTPGEEEVAMTDEEKTTLANDFIAAKKAEHEGL